MISVACIQPRSLAPETLIARLVPRLLRVRDDYDFVQAIINFARMMRLYVFVVFVVCLFVCLFVCLIVVVVVVVVVVLHCFLRLYHLLVT